MPPKPVDHLGPMKLAVNSQNAAEFCVAGSDPRWWGMVLRDSYLLVSSVDAIQ